MPPGLVLLGRHGQPPTVLSATCVLMPTGPNSYTCPAQLSHVLESLPGWV